MGRRLLLLFGLSVLVGFGIGASVRCAAQGLRGGATVSLVKLPPPRLKGAVSVEQAIKRRRTIRRFSAKPLTLQQLSQILWAAQGITDDEARLKRAAPSAGALYPLEIYLTCGEKSVQDLSAGTWHYLPSSHSVSRTGKKDARTALALASYFQMWADDAPVVFVIAAQYERTTRKYGDRGIRYVDMEAGNVSQNIFLQCEALGLSAGIIGAFWDGKVSSALKLPERVVPLLIMPVGYRKG